MWIDTHCHLDAPEFSAQSAAEGATEALAAVQLAAVGLSTAAARNGVGMIVIPAVERANFATVASLAHSIPNACYALGIHPMYVARAQDDDLLYLRQQIQAALAANDSRLVAVGEIGLDLFIPELKSGSLRARQDYFYLEQLKLAREFGLPVLLHVRRSQDEILKQLRRIRVTGGIAHAFNGSFQQAGTFINLGFKLGLGGAMTFARALQIRRLATELPLAALVLETDAPDIAPAWLHPGLNRPDQIPAIAQVLAELRGLTLQQVASATSGNARAVLPRLAQFWLD
jgi:TatD DNase family protein